MVNYMEFMFYVNYEYDLVQKGELIHFTNFSSPIVTPWCPLGYLGYLLLKYFKGTRTTALRAWYNFFKVHIPIRFAQGIAQLTLRTSSLK
jgi:hypothetical protein